MNRPLRLSRNSQQWLYCSESTRTYAASTMSRDAGLMLIYADIQIRRIAHFWSNVLTLPTASPTSSFISIFKFRLKLPPSSGDVGEDSTPTWRFWDRSTASSGSEGVNDGLLEFARLAGGAETDGSQSCPLRTTSDMKPSRW
jgi:hypothetical protein